MALIVFGFVCILLGWYGAAHSPYLYQEVPYLISGGLLGVALVIGGGVLVHCAWSMRQVEEDRRNALAIVRSVDRLERMLRSLDETAARAGRASRRARGACRAGRARPVTARPPARGRGAPARRRRQLAVALSVAVLTLCASACGSRLGGHQAALAQGSGSQRAGRRAPAGSGTTGGHGSPGDTTTTWRRPPSLGRHRPAPRGTAGTAGHPGGAGHGGLERRRAGGGRGDVGGRRPAAPTATRRRPGATAAPPRPASRPPRSPSATSPASAAWPRA